jgi:hypothetical protein
MSRALVATLLAALAAAACSGTPPTTPKPPPPVITPDPPANTAPSIDGITVQGRRLGQPSGFANVKDIIDITATVRDSETSLDELVYQWTASVGTITGTGRVVTWTAPDTTADPVKVTLTLKVIENYGHPGQPKIYSHERTATATVNLHDSAKEIGSMTLRFLDGFSNPQTNKNWQDILRDFKGSACPDPRLADLERDDVVNHYTNFFMHSYQLDPAVVSLGFGNGCAFRGRPGDACAAVSVRWNSTDLRTGVQGQARGIDYVAAAYSTADSRWWLCSSDFDPTTTFGASFYIGR